MLTLISRVEMSPQGCI